MGLNVAVCDNEPIVCEDISERLLRLRPSYRVTCFYSGDELLRSEADYDMIFLDIAMPDMDGMTVAIELRRNGFQGFLIFLTGFAEFMQDAFRVKAFRYLTKPVSKERLLEALTESEKEIAASKRRIVSGYGKEELVHISDILYVKAEKNKTVLYTKSGKIETGSTLNYWNEELCKEGFFQTHRSYLVSLRYITCIEETEITIRYTDQKVPVSRRKYPDVKKAFFTYMAEHARIM